jgi:PHD/YefM family antitoxin component YafN of YafNO toxin-antitoxin module
MKQIVYSVARQTLKSVLDEVVNTGTPIKIIRRDHCDSVVMIRESEYISLITISNNKKDKGNDRKRY